MERLTPLRLAWSAIAGPDGGTTWPAVDAAVGAAVSPLHGVFRIAALLEDNQRVTYIYNGRADVIRLLGE
jgi:hypothetical protein